MIYPFNGTEKVRKYKLYTRPYNFSQANRQLLSLLILLLASASDSNAQLFSAVPREKVEEKTNTVV